MYRTKSQIRIFENSEKLAAALAESFGTAVNQATRANRDFFVALSGGSTPALLFQKLASAPYRENIAWQNIHFFWGDERCVPSDHPESNYGMTRKNLLDHIAILDENIHRIFGENPPEDEAKRYASEIKRWLPLTQTGWPEFDWIMLGLGEDGHTASIFPGSAVMEDRDNIYAVAIHPATGQQRITLTLPAINQARRISFLVTGENKAKIVAKVLSKNEPLPAALVQPIHGILEWYLDVYAGELMR